MRRAGAQRLSTIETLKKLGDGKLTKETAQTSDFMKMVGVCIAEFTDQDLEKFKSGKYQTLPTQHANVAMDGSGKAEKMLMDMEDELWASLGAIAGKLSSEVKASNKGNELPPMWLGLAFGVPLLG